MGWVGRRVTLTILGNLHDITFNLNGMQFFWVILFYFISLFFEWLGWPMPVALVAIGLGAKREAQMDCLPDSLSEGAGLRPMCGLLAVEMSEVWDLSESCLQETRGQAETPKVLLP